MILLESGAELEITLAPFKDGKALLQAVLEEAKGLKVDANTEIDVNLFKDLFCTGIYSKKIESCLWECMKRATYNKNRITEDTFESVDARGDYLQVCFEVAKENLMPFTKGLYAQFKGTLEKLKTTLK